MKQFVISETCAQAKHAECAGCDCGCHNEPLKWPRGKRPASGVAMRWQAYCECGWQGAVWGGSFRQDAYAELRWHKEHGDAHRGVA